MFVRSVFYLGLSTVYCISPISGVRLDLHLGESTFSLVLSHPMDQSSSFIPQTQVFLVYGMPLDSYGVRALVFHIAPLLFLLDEISWLK